MIFLTSRWKRLAWAARTAGVAAALLVAVAGPSSADVFRRHGTPFPVGPKPAAVAAADLDDDGIPEIVTADRGNLIPLQEDVPANNRVSLMVAREPLKYSRTELPVGFGPYALAIANVDAQKALDIVVGCFHTPRDNDIILCRNIPGDGAFEYTSFRVPDEALPYTKQLDADNRPVFSKPGVTSVLVHDFDGDTLRDVVATGWSSDVLIYFPGHAETYFGEPRTMPAPGGPRDVAAADLDGDGKTDLVTSQYSTDELAFWRGDGRGSFEEVRRIASGGKLPHKVAIADVDGNGRRDVIVSHCYTEDLVAIHYGQGSGFEFPTTQRVDLGTARDVMTHEIRDMVVADFTGDGRPDIAVACFASHQVILLVNTSTGPGVPQTFRRERYDFKEARPRALCAADFDGDGKLDLAVATWEPNEVVLLLNR